MGTFETLRARLIREGLAVDKSQADEMILKGHIEVNGQPVTRHRQVRRTDSVRLTRRDRWVSRGAYKLLTAFDRFPVSASGKVCLDVGASTGGFTQVLLDRGAALVYALDVGYGLLDPQLSRDSRVQVVDRTNARTLPPDVFDPAPTLVVSDVSFIPLAELIAPLVAAAAGGAEFVLLVKPQFELEPALVPAGGIVRDRQLHRQAIAQVLSAAARSGLGPLGLVPSAITGTKGNQEYLLYLAPCVQRWTGEQIDKAMEGGRHS